MIVCKAMNARNKAGNQDNEKMNYEKEMEKCLNSIFCNLRALEEIRRVRVAQRCEEVKKGTKCRHGNFKKSYLRS